MPCRLHCVYLRFCLTSFCSACICTSRYTSRCILPLCLSDQRGIVVACVCPSVRKLYIISLIICRRFELKSSNLHQNMHTGIPLAGIENGGHSPWPLSSFRVGHFDLEISLVRTVTCYGFGLQSLDMQQICILGFPLLVLKWGVIDLDLHSHWTIINQNFRKRHSTSHLNNDLDRPRHALIDISVSPVYKWLFH